MSAEVKVVEFWVDYLLKRHDMNKEDVFVKVGIIQNCKQTQQVRRFFVELIFYKTNNHYWYRCRTMTTLYPKTMNLDSKGGLPLFRMRVKVLGCLSIMMKLHKNDWCTSPLVPCSQ